MAALARKRDTYERVTQRILDELDKGTAPWDRPWDVHAGLPMSMSSRKHYNGMNLFLLMLEQMSNGYRSNWWGTYRQIENLGGQVRRGEKGSMVILWKRTERTVANDAGDPETRKGLFLTSFTVFNAAQADGLPEKFTVPPKRHNEPIETCERIIAGYANGPTIVHGGDRASYSPSADRIRVPEIHDFEVVEEYYSTLFHEETHGTGHKSRLNRPGIVENHHFGDEMYSKEELIAELGSAFLCGIAGIEKVTLEHSASYIDNWRSAIGNDPKLVVQAAGAAQKACDFVLGDTDVEIDVTEDDEHTVGQAA